VSFADVLVRRIRVQGIFVGSRADLVRYLEFVERHAIEPVIDRVFDGLRSARAAFAHLVGGHHVGKVVIRVATEYAGSATPSAAPSRAGRRSSTSLSTRAGTSSRWER
jgi:Zinc-binding dehydrogenase